MEGIGYSDDFKRKAENLQIKINKAVSESLITSMKHNIGLIIISTGNYHKFIEPLLDSARKFFMIEDNVTFYLFTDSLTDYGEDVVTIPTKREAWPGPTLHRYRNIINSKGLLSNNDYLFYVDADSLMVAPIGREILSDGLTAVLHPGFAMFPGKGSWETNPKSGAYTKNKSRYACGGFNGAKTSAFLSASAYMAAGIDEDEKMGITAIHHDESWINKVVGDLIPECYWLDPSYMMVEETEKRKLWKIDHLTPKILALKKDHSLLRKC